MGENKVPVNMKIDRRFKMAARSEAKKRGTSITGLFIQLVTPFLPENVEKLHLKLNSPPARAEEIKEGL